jgi:hypothetical protein
MSVGFTMKLQSRTENAQSFDSKVLDCSAVPPEDIRRHEIAMKVQLLAYGPQQFFLTAKNRCRDLTFNFLKPSWVTVHWLFGGLKADPDDLNAATQERQARGLRNSPGSREHSSRSQAGFAPAEANACRLEKRPDIKARIQVLTVEITGKALKKAEVTVEKVIEELARLGFSNMMDYVQTNPDGTASVDLWKLTRDQAAAINEV